MKRSMLPAAVLLPVLLLVGCAGEPEPVPTVTETVTVSPRPAPTVTVTVTPTPTAAAPAPAVEPDRGRDRTYALAVLREIDPGLASNEDRAVGRLDDICLDIEQGKDDATLARNAELRFEGGTVPDITAEDAVRIVTTARDYYC